MRKRGAIGQGCQCLDAQIYADSGRGPRTGRPPSSSTYTRTNQRPASS